MAESLLAAIQAKKNVIPKPPPLIAIAPEREFNPLPPKNPPQFDFTAQREFNPPPTETIKKPLNIPSPQIINRPTSIAKALDIFGPSQVDNLLGTLFEFEATEGDINASANQAGIIRRLLVCIIILCSGASVILNSAPLCGKNDPQCLANTAMIASIINAVGLLFLFILEKISTRNQAVRLRDLGMEFSSLSNELRNALYINPPAQHEAQTFLMNINARAAELKTRAISYKVRPQPIRGQSRNRTMNV